MGPTDSATWLQKGRGKEKVMCLMRKNMNHVLRANLARETTHTRQVFESGRQALIVSRGRLVCTRDDNPEGCLYVARGRAFRLA